MLRDTRAISLHIVNDRLVVGGVTTIIRMIHAEGLKQGGHYRLWVDETDGALERETTRLSWGLQRWRKWLTLACAFLPLKLVLAILQDKLQGRRPVLHLNTPYLSTAIAAMSAACFTRTPLVYTVHANRSHISGFYWRIENIVFRFAERIVLELSVSLSDYRDKDQAKISFIPFGVRRVNTVKKWSVRSGGSFTFVAVNRMDPNRMVDVFIKAFAMQMSENDSRLHLVGDGVHKAELIELAAGLGCGNRVQFFPSVDEAGIQDILVECDCFLTLAASGEVGMAGKLAAGVGIPCLAYEFDQRAARDYSAVSVEELSQKMGLLAKACQSALDSHAKKTTSALYSCSEDMVDSYMTTYNKVAK